MNNKICTICGGVLDSQAHYETGCSERIFEILGKEKIPEFHKNLPLRAINQVVFRGDNGFEEATTVLLLQPEKTRTLELLISAGTSRGLINNAVEQYIANLLPQCAPFGFVLLAIHSNGEPLQEADRKSGKRAWHFIFVEPNAFEFRELTPEDFRPRALEIKVLENGLRFYADASYLIYNEENAPIPPEVEAEFGEG